MIQTKCLECKIDNPYHVFPARVQIQPLHQRNNKDRHIY